MLASGGIDSTALIHNYLSKGETVRLLHFQYGQPSSRGELNAIKKIAHHYRLNFQIVRLGFRMFMRRYEFLGRNALFVLTASSLGPPPLRIALGINRGPEYYDISPRFVANCQQILDGYFAGTVALEAPFVELSKHDIIKFCLRKRIPLNLTYSCQKKNSPCGECPSCLDRKIFLGTR